MLFTINCLGRQDSPSCKYLFIGKVQFVKNVAKMHYKRKSLFNYNMDGKKIIDNAVAVIKIAKLILFIFNFKFFILKYEN